MKIPDNCSRLLGNHILSDVGENLTHKEKIEYVWQRFLLEKDGAVKARNKRKLFIDWLSGLPSAMPIEGYNSDIFEVGKKIGLFRNDSSDSDIEDFVYNWFEIVADTFLNMKNEQ